MLQHRVSKFYLGCFLPSRGRPVLCEYRKGSGFAGEITPKKASREADAFEYSNTLEGAIETYFGQIETAVAPLIKQIRLQRALSECERRSLATFAALFFARSERRSHELSKIQSLFTHSQLKRFFADSGTRIDYLIENPHVSARQYDRIVTDYLSKLESGFYAPPIVPKGPQSLLIENARTKWTDCLVQMQWSFEIAPSGSFFVLGDEPLVARIPDRPFGSGYVGISRSELGVEISLPINRGICLVARHADALETKHVVVSTDRVDELNIRSVFAAHDVFYSPLQSPKCDECVRTVGSRSIIISPPTELLSFISLRDKAKRDIARE